MLEAALGQMKAILRGSDDNAIATFNASHRAIKDAIQRIHEPRGLITQMALAEAAPPKAEPVPVFRVVGERELVAAGVDDVRHLCSWRGRRC